MPTKKILSWLLFACLGFNAMGNSFRNLQKETKLLNFQHNQETHRILQLKTISDNSLSDFRSQLEDKLNREFDNIFPEGFAFPDFSKQYQGQFELSGAGFGSSSLRGINCTLPRKLLQGQCKCDVGTVYLTIVDRCIVTSQSDQQKNDYLNKFRKVYRSIDGSGNNNEHKDWGSANSLLQRLLPPAYTDRVSKPVENRPNPRIISNTVGSMSGELSLSRQKLTNLFTIWGQFVDHDLSITPFQKGDSAEEFSINIPKFDPTFDSTGTGNKAIKFTRSIYGPSSNPRTQINTVTSWLDGSQIYGSDQSAASQLRTFVDGKLKTSGNNLMPQDRDGFFQAGDTRANQNIALCSLHILFVRQHNRIAQAMKRSDQKLGDEEIYQLSRFIVIAQLSKITYDDWLPHLIGQDLYNKYIAKYRNYDNKANPNIQTQFSTAAFRIGHPLLIDKFKIIDNKDKVVKNLALSQMFFNPTEFKQNPQALENILRGLFKTNNKEKSGQIVNSVRNMLILGPDSKNINEDLYSLNIQRGRDHGLQDYNTVRDFLGIGRIPSFDYLTKDRQTSQKLSTAYTNPNNLDLWVGIICEQPMNKSVLGQVGGTIVGDTFRRIRDGDWFWYEKTLPQSTLQSIKNTTLADIIKRNTNSIDVQKDVFHYSP